MINDEDVHIRTTKGSSTTIHIHNYRNSSHIHNYRIMGNTSSIDSIEQVLKSEERILKSEERTLKSEERILKLEERIHQLTSRVTGLENELSKRKISLTMINDEDVHICITKGTTIHIHNYSSSHIHKYRNSSHSTVQSGSTK